MNGFPPVTLTFGEKEYEVQPDKVWGLINAIERHCGLAQLAIMVEKENPRRVLLIEAYHAALQYAGCKASVDEVNQQYAMLDVFALINTLAAVLQLAEPEREVTEDLKQKQVLGKQKASAKKGSARAPTKSG